MPSLNIRTVDPRVVALRHGAACPTRHMNYRWCQRPTASGRSAPQPNRTPPASVCERTRNHYCCAVIRKVGEAYTTRTLCARNCIIWRRPSLRSRAYVVGCSLVPSVVHCPRSTLRKAGVQGRTDHPQPMSDMIASLATEMTYV